MTPALSDALAQEALNVLAQFNGNQVHAARHLKMSRGGFQGRIAEAKARGFVPNAAHAAADDVQALQAKVRRLEMEVRAHGRQSEELDIIKGVIGSMARKVEELDSPVWMVQPKGADSVPGVPTLFISDLHWGETVFPAQINNVNEYNLQTARGRLRLLFERAVHLLKIISPSMNYPGIVVPLGGDMISGNIHDELTATNELNSMPAVEDLYKELVSLISALADTFGRVFLPCVSGNHGRDTRKIWAKDRHATSFDWLLYRFLALRFDVDKRVTFFIPDGPDAYYKVYDHAYLLTHGDSFRGGDGVIGVMGPIIRGDHKKRSRNAQVDMEYDTMLLGHFHQYVHHGRFIINGSLKGYDEYAYANNFGFEPPQQALWLTHPKYRITYRMPVYVDYKRTAPKTTWASVPHG
ncbi:MAG: hypothetical protein ACYDBH_00355 [Acidobacteriaceae bacterium]